MIKVYDEASVRLHFWMTSYDTKGPSKHLLIIDDDLIHDEEQQRSNLTSRETAYFFSSLLFPRMTDIYCDQKRYPLC
jgi:hypothetical protein